MILCSARLQQDPQSPKPAPSPLEPSSGPLVSPGQQQLLCQLFHQESNNCWDTCFTRKATNAGPLVSPGKQQLLGQLFYQESSCCARRRHCRVAKKECWCQLRENVSKEVYNDETSETHSRLMRTFLWRCIGLCDHKDPKGEEETHDLVKQGSERGGRNACLGQTRIRIGRKKRMALSNRDPNGAEETHGLVRQGQVQCTVVLLH